MRAGISPVEALLTRVPALRSTSGCVTASVAQMQRSQEVARQLISSEQRSPWGCLRGSMLHRRDSLGRGDGGGPSWLGLTARAPE